MRVAAIALLLVAAPGVAAAGGIACPLSEAGSIAVDGMLDDWEGVGHSRAGGKAKEASFDLRCVTDGERLALSIDVRDDGLSRRTKPHRDRLGDDHVIVALTAGGEPLTITLYPGMGRIAPRRQLGGKKLPAWIAAEDTQQPRGWSVELELPLAKIPGWSAAHARIDASVTLADADELGDAPTPLVHELGLGLGDRPALVERFLEDARLKAKDVRLDEVADVDPATPGTERVIAGGKVLGLVAETYGWVELPVDRAADVRRVELVDLRGDGTRVVLTELRQHGGGGSRDVVMVWSARGGRFEPLLTVEVRKEADGNSIESEWAIQEKKKKKKRSGTGTGTGTGSELHVRAGVATGWDQDTFEEVPAEDAEPIHLPWDEARPGTAYWLDGDTVRSRPLPAPKKRR